MMAIEAFILGFVLGAVFVWVLVVMRHIATRFVREQETIARILRRDLSDYAREGEFKPLRPGHSDAELRARVHAQDLVWKLVMLGSNRERNRIREASAILAKLN